jgi:hypothetical protein
LFRSTKNHLFALTPLPLRHQQTENSSIAMADQTIGEAPRKHRRVETNTPAPQYYPQLPILYMPSSHQVSFPHTIAPTKVRMPPTNQPAVSDQRRTSSRHSIRTTTGPEIPQSHFHPQRPPPGFGFGPPNVAQTGPPSYASDHTISPTFPPDKNNDQHKPPSRPELEHMIVAVNRQKLSSDDMQWTTQFPLENLRSSNDKSLSISKLSFSRLLGEISDNLRSEVNEEGLSVVWVLSNIDQLGVVRDDGSLRAVVLDHQNAGKHTVQLYVVREKGQLWLSSILLPQASNVVQLRAPRFPNLKSCLRRLSFCQRSLPYPTSSAQTLHSMRILPDSPTLLPTVSASENNIRFRRSDVPR